MTKAADSMHSSCSQSVMPPNLYTLPITAGRVYNALVINLTFSSVHFLWSAADLAAIWR